jgi:hypothetical protein
MVALAPRVTTIEGRRVLIVEKHPPLPPQLALLLNGGRDRTGRVWAAMRILHRRPLTLAGARSECLSESHRLVPWLDGSHVGSDNVTRSLHLDACADCGAISVRDASFDVLDRLPTGGRPLRRKDHVIGWYTGARPGNREYR